MNAGALRTEWPPDERARRRRRRLVDDAPRLAPAPAPAPAPALAPVTTGLCGTDVLVSMLSILGVRASAACAAAPRVPEPLAMGALPPSARCIISGSTPCAIAVGARCTGRRGAKRPGASAECRLAVQAGDYHHTQAHWSDDERSRGRTSTRRRASVCNLARRVHGKRYPPHVARKCTVKPTAAWFKPAAAPTKALISAH